jgi:NADH:ubiquinone oxidoreductase subunit 3 (subunit A)
MMKNIFLSIPAAFLFFVVLFTFLYFFLIRFSAKGKDHPEKYLPYSGGQQLPPKEVRLSYQAFFRIGLLFGILHVSALMISTLPLKSSTMGIGILYLAGISISAFVLAKTDFT